MISSWSLADAIRYFYYFLKTVGWCPYPVEWLRYNAFLVLYPIGMFSEIGLALNALYVQLQEYMEHKREKMKAIENNEQPPAKPKSRHRLASVHNLLLIGYVLLAFYSFPKMFQHMLQQREKFYAKKAAAK